MLPGSTREITYEQVRGAFDRLPEPGAESGLAYNTAELAGELVRIGKAATGYPVLVVERGSAGFGPTPDRHYANLRLRHNRRLRLKNGHEVRTYSVLECIARDRAVQDWFLRLLPWLCQQLVVSPSPEVLEQRVAWLSELFRVFDSTVGKSMTGIWAELYVLSQADDLNAAVAGWHVCGTSTHDFTAEGSCVEVKATRGTQRRHDFSAEQLQPTATVLVASLLLEPSDAGPSVLDLYSSVVSRLAGSPDICDKVHRLVISLVGKRLAEADDTRFDTQSAADGLRCYAAGSVPQITPPFPLHVSGVRFLADLAPVDNINEPDRLAVPLWANLFPQ